MSTSSNPARLVTVTERARQEAVWRSNALSASRGDIRAAKREIHMAKGSHAFDYMVINDDLDRAVTEIEKIIKHQRSGGI